MTARPAAPAMSDFDRPGYMSDYRSANTSLLKVKRDIKEFQKRRAAGSAWQKVQALGQPDDGRDKDAAFLLEACAALIAQAGGDASGTRWRPVIDFQRAEGEAAAAPPPPRRLPCRGRSAVVCRRRRPALHVAAHRRPAPARRELRR